MVGRGDPAWAAHTKELLGGETLPSSECKVVIQICTHIHTHSSALQRGKKGQSHCMIIEELKYCSY